MTATSETGAHRAGGSNSPFRTSVANLGLAAGLVILVALWGGPLARMARTAYSPHMLLHLGVMVVACPLLSWWLSRRLPGLYGFRDAISWALLASFFDMLAVWGWHIPLFHALAERQDGLFALQQASFLAAGLSVWTMAMSARTRAAAGAGALGMLLTFMHMTMFGLVITITPELIYAPDICQGAWGLKPLDDQHLGGIMMATLGALPYLVGSIVAAWVFAGVGWD
jgi:putative membrane protein